MADLAAVFGWTPPVMDSMDLADLMRWREEARKRSGADE